MTRAATPAALAAITAVAAALRLASFAHVPPNPFYDAAVRSMAQSWHNFFYGAFEPSARVSIDKIPVDLWLQVASVKLLGFSSTATRLPEALAGIAAVALLYDVVRRPFGRAAGLGAAAALAVMPIAVLTARSDTDGCGDDGAGRPRRVAHRARSPGAEGVADRRRRRGPGHRVQRQALRRAPRPACARCARRDGRRRARPPARCGGGRRACGVRRRERRVADDRLAGPVERQAVADRVDQRQRVERRLRLQRCGPPAFYRVGGGAQARPARPAALRLDSRARLRRPGRHDPARRAGLRVDRARRRHRRPGGSRAPAPRDRHRGLRRAVARRRRRGAQLDAALRAALPGGRQSRDRRDPRGRRRVARHARTPAA